VSPPVDPHDDLRAPHPTLRLEGLELRTQRTQRTLSAHVLGRWIFAAVDASEPGDPSRVETIEDDAERKPLSEPPTEASPEASGVQRLDHSLSERLWGQRHGTS